MQIKETPEQNTASIRLTTSVAELPQIVGTCFGEVAGVMLAQQVPFAGFPFVIYYNMDMQALDAEIGFPVGRPIEAAGRVKPSKLPAGKVVSELHTGPYAKLSETYEKVMASIQRDGLKVAPWMYESYLNSPEEVPESELKTEICFPLV
jgi:effector-binding domain-containing protein